MELIELLNWYCLFYFILGLGAFILSTIGGGGGALVMVPVSTWMVGATLTPQTLNTGSFLQRPSRLILYWKDIHWDIIIYFVPSTLVGAFVGAWLFADLEAVWLKVIVGAFLISTIFQYRFGKKERSFAMKKVYFIPVALVTSFIGTLVGAIGPVLNPFFLNAGIDKEDMIATKTANVFIMGIIQIGSYTYFGTMSAQIWIYAISLGIGASLGNIIGKKILKKMSSKQFRQWVIFLLLISGLVMIAEVIMAYL